MSLHIKAPPGLNHDALMGYVREVVRAATPTGNKKPIARCTHSLWGVVRVTHNPFGLTGNGDIVGYQCPDCGLFEVAS